MKTATKKELDLIELGILTEQEMALSHQLENAVAYYWFNKIKPEWKTFNDISFDLSEFEDWI